MFNFKTNNLEIKLKIIRSGYQST